MTRYLLDTNIVSDALKPRPSTAIAEWVVSQDDSDLFIATLTVAEIWRGVLSMPAGRRRDELRTWFAGPQGPQALFHDRVLSFDERAAIEWGRIVAEGRSSGRPRSPLDMVIAATAAANHCIVVTANERHFQGAVDFLNPLRLAD
ncbi:MAG TPA: PIN domain-containing protein [Stellaceae bacterium]|nr:PIN domain-containing protein [Stellaceae bacterium]